jgi:hypothetical protein
MQVPECQPGMFRSRHADKSGCHVFDRRASARGVFRTTDVMGVTSVSARVYQAPHVDSYRTAQSYASGVGTALLC